MALQVAHTTLMLPEALVIESLLEAHGIRFYSAGQDIVAQVPQIAIAVGGISIWVEEQDLAEARSIIGSGDEVAGYKSIESVGFERNPVRNAVLAFFILIMGAPFPFWYRNAGDRTEDMQQI